MPRKKSAGSTPVTSVKHKDKRANIPTKELRDFVADDEKQPKTMLYPRDPSLDPQLVWKGKDEQDRADLAVPAVPIYIQEKIQPQAIIENLRAEVKKEIPQQASLFADFNGITFEDLVDFYRHEQNWSNRMILGDSLLVMTSLAEKEGLKGKVQMIYLDPPYGIKFGSNWQVSTRKRDVKDGKAEDATRQPEQVKAFRDTWQLGIHSYLAYLRDRLIVARELLTESGSIFVQIGDENVHLVRCVLDEVFGSENFVSLIAYRTSIGLGAEYLDNVSNYLVWYGKNREIGSKYRAPLKQLIPGEQGATRYSYALSPDREEKLIGEDEDEASLIAKGWRLFTDQGLTSRTGSATTTFDFSFRGKSYRPTAGGWRTNAEGMKRVALADRILKAGDTIRFRKLFDDFGCIALTNQWEDVSGGVSSRADPKVYVVQTSTEIVKRCVLMTTDPGDLVIDPTCGSGTTAYVAEQWGRRWITIDTSRVALALARTRLMAGRFPYYLLADSAEGRKKEVEASGQLSVFSEQSSVNGDDIKKGFVYKRVPHITLKSIANNEEIDTIHARWQEKLEAIRHQLNSLLGKNWQEWEIPREPSGENPKSEIRNLHAEWWRLRRERQKEIDESISRHADTELLYDQPYEDNKRIRSPARLPSRASPRIVFYPQMTQMAQTKICVNLRHLRIISRTSLSKT